VEAFSPQIANQAPAAPQGLVNTAHVGPQIDAARITVGYARARLDAVRTATYKDENQKRGDVAYAERRLDNAIFNSRPGRDMMERQTQMINHPVHVPENRGGWATRIIPPVVPVAQAAPRQGDHTQSWLNTGLRDQAHNVRPVDATIIDPVQPAVAGWRARFTSKRRSMFADFLAEIADPIEAAPLQSTSGASSRRC
jgi:hypothetical protein